MEGITLSRIQSLFFSRDADIQASRAQRGDIEVGALRGCISL